MRLEVHGLSRQVEQGEVDVAALRRPSGHVYAYGPVVLANVEGSIALGLEAHDDARLARLAITDKEERQAPVDPPGSLHLPQKPHRRLAPLLANLMGNGPQLRAPLTRQAGEQRQLQDVCEGKRLKAPARRTVEAGERFDLLRPMRQVHDVYGKLQSSQSCVADEARLHSAVLHLMR